MNRPASFARLFVVLLVGCTGSEPRSVSAVAPPIVLTGRAYEAAATVDLVDTAPTELPGLHNVFRLSKNIISGAEPHGEQALKSIASMGVKTVLSVDGKAPDVEAARKHGLTYVHVPIQYKGITRDELLSITKAFRELEGPFFVHCFHGKHRGPAAAAVGRLVLDGISREQALAEMRQWCGTAEAYEGLYQVVAAGAIPTAAETAAHRVDFAATAEFGGVRQLMIDLSRHYDHLEAASKRGWGADPEHPDLDVVNEATILAQLFAKGADQPDLQAKPQDHRDWMTASVAQSQGLLAAVSASRQGGTDWKPSDQAFKALKATCTACHEVYRND